MTWSELQGLPNNQKVHAIKTAEHEELIEWIWENEMDVANDVTAKDVACMSMDGVIGWHNVSDDVLRDELYSVFEAYPPDWVPPEFDDPEAKLMKAKTMLLTWMNFNHALANELLTLQEILGITYNSVTSRYE